MLPIALNPYLDDILRRHVMRAARANRIPLHVLEASFRSESDAIAFLRRCGWDTYEAYVLEADEAVDHHGWILTDASSASSARA